jgi:hypothetical protein
LLGKVRERGYALLTATLEVLQRHDALLTAFELSDRLPRQERAVQQATAELAASAVTMNVRRVADTPCGVRRLPGCWGLDP